MTMEDSVEELQKPFEALSLENTSGLPQSVRTEGFFDGPGTGIKKDDLMRAFEDAGVSARQLGDALQQFAESIRALNNSLSKRIVTDLRERAVDCAADCPHLKDLNVDAIFSHFNHEIEEIVLQVCSNATHHCPMWKIAEACYNETYDDRLRLHPFLLLDHLHWPYDPGDETERLDIDDDYVERFKKQCQMWTELWVHILDKCEGGPTLFYPRTDDTIKNDSLKSKDIPRYLFRTFDTKSNAVNNDEDIASGMSEVSPEDSRKSIMSLPFKDGADMLYGHRFMWNEECRNRDPRTGNLVSWTSSLLFAIQYAIFRHYRHKCPKSDIKICAVDTRKFPRTQFTRAMQLAHEYCSHPEEIIEDEAERELVWWLRSLEHDNGEYISQGSLHHQDRSTVLSRADLEKHGLYQLFPEFEDNKGSKRLMNRAIDLRKMWLNPCTTKEGEVRMALRISMECFGESNLSDMAIMLLSFKSRNYGLAAPNTTSSQIGNGLGCLEEPDEVKRYEEATSLLRNTYNHANSGLPDGLTQSQGIENMFERVESTLRLLYADQ